MGEDAIQFSCAGDRLHGVLHMPAEPSTRGVVVVVGGPQYRVGSHRQFVLLARALAAAGIPVLRFDYRGIGDSEGAVHNFEQVTDDIRAAVDFFRERVPSLREVVLWGLCDAASAVLFYASGDTRVTGVALLNPWVHTHAGKAKVYLRHYYFARALDPDLWRKIVRGKFEFGTALRSFAAMLSAGFGRGARTQESASLKPSGGAGQPLPARMLCAFKAYRGRVLLVLSGDDLTAGEFKELVRGSRAWRAELRTERVTRRDLTGANHTFARREWRDQVSAWTVAWVKSW